MKDYLVKAIAFDQTIRIYAINASNTVRQAQKIHGTWPSATAALGRTMVISAMMGSMLKGNERLTVRVQGGGPIGEIIVDANAKGEVRGFVSNPEVHFQYPEGKLNVAQTVGTKGEIHVIKDLGLREYFTSTVEIVSGELGEDFTYYFAKSEQTPASVGAGVLVDTDNTVIAAGGFIIQVMPGVTEETLDKLESILTKIKPISQMIAEGYQPEDIIDEITQGEAYLLVGELDVQYACDCHKDRFARGLVSLGKEELRNIIDEDGQAEIVCRFCKTKYHFNREELEDLYQGMQK